MLRKPKCRKIWIREHKQKTKANRGVNLVCDTPHDLFYIPTNYHSNISNGELCSGNQLPADDHHFSFCWKTWLIKLKKCSGNSCLKQEERLKESLRVYFPRPLTVIQVTRYTIRNIKNILRKDAQQYSQ